MCKKIFNVMSLDTRASTLEQWTASRSFSHPNSPAAEMSHTSDFYNHCRSPHVTSPAFTFLVAWRPLLLVRRYRIFRLFFPTLACRHIPNINPHEHLRDACLTTLLQPTHSAATFPNGSKLSSKRNSRATIYARNENTRISPSRQRGACDVCASTKKAGILCDQSMRIGRKWKELVRKWFGRYDG